MSDYLIETKQLTKTYGDQAVVKNIDYSGRSAHALKRVQRTGIAVQQSSAAVQPRPLGMG